MSLETQFVDRTKAVIAYLRALKDLEKAHRTPGRGFYRGAAAISASRAASFIMMYNCIEFGIRETAGSLRRSISESGRDFVDLKPHWREEIVRMKFYDRVQQGTNHIELMRDFASFIPGEVNWGAHVERIPFAGNIDNKRLLDFVKRLGHRWSPPRSTLGGTDLDLIKRIRNDLAHGKEDFESVGAQFDSDELIEKFLRARVFTVSLIRTLERYSNDRKYLL
jgi:hypothetical protein